jgi:putative transposase
LVRPDHPRLSIRRQCRLLNLTRSSLYYVPTAVSEEEIRLTKEIDRIFTKWPFYGARKIVWELRGRGNKVNRKRVQRLMRMMGLQALVPGPHTSKPHPEHPIYPYLLGRMDIIRPDQAWAADITYIPLEYGWAYLIAIIDWYSRAILAWRLSNTMTVEFCIEALEDALRHHGPPEVFNTDQGGQFTSPDFTGTLKRAGITISMDGKGRATDNVFVERVWRSLKYEDVYLHNYEELSEAQTGIGRWIHFYNEKRPHQSLGNHRPMEIYNGFHTLESPAA